MNRLYYGDNLPVLREHLADESVDLIYLDPPFNSDANYNVLFKEQDGARAAAQIKAFEDTWSWDADAARAYEETVETGGKLSEALQAFRKLVGESDMLAYLSMMAPRLRELRRVLKPSGSIYLHCDPTASHYLKLLLDAIFGTANYRNEIVWRRSHPKGHASTRFARNHDVIIAFAKDFARVRWNQTHLPHDPERVAKQYASIDESGRPFQLTSLLNPNPDRPNLTYEFLGVTKVWRWTKERMLEEHAKGHIVVPKSGKGIPRYKRYLDEQEGIPIGDFWDDIEFVSGAERLGYPTQKPIALLERIIKSNSNEGDVVLDPFCGCGTTIDAAQKLNRQWIGIDITHLAINLIRHRLRDTYGDEMARHYKVIGEPASIFDARVLAASDPYQFQWWALGLVGARPVEMKKGADKGIDGRLYFHDAPQGGKTKQIILSVKSGKVGVKDVRELRAVIDREQAEIGVFVSMLSTTREMRTEAASTGTYNSPWGKHPRIQLLTIQDILNGKRIDMPLASGANVTYKKAAKHHKKGDDQMIIREEGEEYR